jgi:hypothetical protein
MVLARSKDWTSAELADLQKFGKIGNSMGINRLIVARSEGASLSLLLGLRY